MNDDLNNKLELLEKAVNDISKNGDVIDEELLTKHPEYLGGLLHCIRTTTGYECYEYNVISEFFNIDEYIMSKGLEYDEELFYQLMINPKYALLEEINVDKKSIKEYLVKTFKDIDMFKNIIKNTTSHNVLMFLFRQYLDIIDIKNISDEFIELFIEKIGKKEILKYTKKYCFSDIVLKKIYNHFEFSISEVEELMKGDCYYGIEYFKNSEEIIRNDKIVKELLKLGYYRLIPIISEEQFISNYNLIEPLLANYMLYILDSENKLTILNNNEIFDKIFNYVDSSSLMNMFVMKLPDNYSDEVRITKCLLNGYEKDELNGVERFDENWLSNIERAIKDGYKCNQNTLVSTKEEIEIFKRNGQNQIINYVDKNILDYEFVYKCMEEGFNLAIDNHYSTYIINRYIKEFGASKRVTHLKSWVFFFPDLQYDFTADYIIEKSFTDDGPTNYFLDKVLFKEEIISKAKSVLTNNNYIKESIIQYVDFIDETKCRFDFINKVDDIDICFDEFGLTEKFYEHVFTSQDCFDCLFFNNNKYLKDFKNKVNCFDYVINYLEFVYKNSLFNILSNYVKSIDDVKEYYNGLGITEKLYELGLFNSTLFNILFRDQEYSKICNFEENINNYIKYSRRNSIFEYVNSKKDIDLYFDEEGPTKELYQKALFDMKLFITMYNDYNYRRKCNFSREIIRYIEYVKERQMMFNFVKSISDIEKYFNQTGPNQLFFENGFSNYGLFTSLLSKSIYKKYCNFPKNIDYYIGFIDKYGLMFDFIHNIEDINKYFGENGATDGLRNYFKENKKLTSSILNNAAHDNQILNNIGIDFVDIFKEYIKDNFFNSIEESEREKKYNYLLKNIGPHIIFNLESPKIKRFIEIDNSELDKFFKTVYSSEVDVLTQELAYNNLMLSIIRYNFEKANSDIINIFTNINSLLVNMDNDEFNNYIDGKITSESSVSLNKYINDIIEELSYNEEDIEKLKKSLIKCKVELKEEDLRKICRKYVKKCRDKYTEEHKESIFSELNISQSFDREDAIKKMSKYFIKEITFKDYCIYLDKFKDKIPNNEYDVLKSITLEEFNLIVNTTGKPDPSIVKKLKPFNMLLSEYSKFEFDNRTNDSLLDFLKVEKKYYIQLKDINMIDIIKELDIDIFLNTIGNNIEILNSLSKLFKNCYLGRLPANIVLFFCKRNEVREKLPGGINNIGTFITKYAQILSDRKRRLEMQGSKTYQLSKINFTFSDIVKLISYVNTETREISRLIGSEEYGDFVSNDSPNTNSYDRLAREGVLVDLLNYLYTLDKITIPSKDIVISNKDNSKQINFIVGNRTNPSNICHGERTGACMRVGGVGEGLFLKCLTDKNWFHIRIEDPVTHEYISRVSGFRNGNTVYLNQLRESSDISKYTNEDLQEFIQIYAESLIEETKTCEYPIENVFINGGIEYNCYAMKTFRSENGKVYSLGAGIQREYSIDEVKDFKLRDSNDIWTDVKNSAVLLATTEEGKKTLEGYAPLKNGPDDALEYSVARDKIYGIHHDDTINLHQFIELDENAIYEKINRVYCMKQKLLGYDYKYLDDVSVEGIIDAYVSSDWYVYIDSSYEIHYDFISEYKLNDELIPYGNSEVAQQEMEHAKQILINKYSLDIKNEVKHAI